MSTLVSRNITVDGRRTSIRLEPTMWEALQEISDREGISIHQFCTQVDQHRHESSLTAAIRVAILMYYRRAMMGGAESGQAAEGADEAASARQGSEPGGGPLPDKPGSDYSAASLPV